MNRRNLLKTLMVAPLLGWPKITNNHLKIRILNVGEWDFPSVEITKGPYKVITPTACDCKDIHGLCATVEVAQIVIRRLELGDENIELIYNEFYDYDEKSLQQIENSLTRVKLTKKERNQIYQFLKALRGPHDCCLEKA